MCIRDRVRAEEQLIKAMDKLPADKAGQLKHYMLTMDELSRCLLYTSRCV